MNQNDFGAFGTILVETKPELFIALYSFMQAIENSFEEHKAKQITIV